ncbi:MAG: CoA transferase [Gammaproteobacteria bacterium AqS3]|nr:CoA transferase [Gammaproteobacteria bacterium AqS3]
MTTTVPNITKPLAGTQIVELSTMVSVSLGTMLLAAQGADVIKIEPTGDGDPMRQLGTQKEGIAALFANCNRGKRSLCVDLKSPQGVELVRRIAGDADVIVNNYRPGVMEKLSLGSEALRAENPGLIFVGVTGFGTMGPMSNDPAYDHIVQALAGFTLVQADGDEPKFIRNIVTDKVTALTTAQAITAALLVRAGTGRGQHIDVSMLHAGLFFLFPDGMMNETYQSDGVSKFPPLADSLTAIPTADGHLAIAPVTDAHWTGLARAVGKPEILDDARFSTNAGRNEHYLELAGILLEALGQLPTEPVLRRLRENDVPSAPCLSPGEALSHEQVQAIGAVSHQTHPILGDLLAVESPIRFGGELGEIERPCPSLGQHSREIALEVGFGEAEISEMSQAGALVG